MERRLENYILDDIVFKEKLKKLFDLLTPEQGVMLLKLELGLGIQELAEDRGVSNSAADAMLREVRNKALKVFK